MPARVRVSVTAPIETSKPACSTPSVFHHVHARRPRTPGARPQDGGPHAGAGPQGRAVLREHRRRPRRRGGQQPTRAAAGAAVCILLGCAGWALINGFSQGIYMKLASSPRSITLSRYKNNSNLRSHCVAPMPTREPPHISPARGPLRWLRTLPRGDTRPCAIAFLSMLSRNTARVVSVLARFCPCIICIEKLICKDV